MTKPADLRAYLRPEAPGSFPHAAAESVGTCIPCGTAPISITHQNR